MTLQTKRFIELADIISLKFECKKCGTTVTIDARKSFSVKTLRICLNCQNDWWGYEDASIDESISQLVGLLQRMQRILDDPARLACNLSLEVKEEVVQS